MSQINTVNPSESVLLDQVKMELQTTANPRSGNLLQSVGVLVVTLLIFLSLGLFQQSLSGVVTVVAVLFIHETGHLIGMKMYGYRDVKMFFIPFLGAAVSGSARNVSALQKAVVALVGPIPGVVLGIIFAIVFFKTQNELCAGAAGAFLFINGFNLLPFHPLDGGRFLDYVLFSRNSKIEIGFKLITGLALAGIGVGIGDKFLTAFAIFALFYLKPTSVAASAACKLRERAEPSDFSDEQVPETQLSYLFDEVRAKLGRNGNNAKLIARCVQDVWQRARTQPPSLSASLGILAVYLPFALIGVSAPFVFEAGKIISETRTAITQAKQPDGSARLVEVKYLKDRKIFEVPINESGFYHGMQTEWDVFSPQKLKQGMWKDGFLHGEWRSWDREGQLESLTEYQMGRPIRYVVLNAGELTEVPENEWPPRVKKTIQTEPLGPAEQQTNQNGVVKTSAEPQNR